MTSPLAIWSNKMSVVYTSSMLWDLTPRVAHSFLKDDLIVKDDLIRETIQLRLIMINNKKQKQEELKGRLK